MIIDVNGQYAYTAGTMKAQTSSHPVYQARIDLALPQGTWLFAPPTAGHTLQRFAKAGNTQAKQDEFQKELSLYLAKYGSAVVNTFTGRYALELDMTIPQGVL